MDEKQETNEYSTGHWIYLRDGSDLNGLLKKELGVNMDREAGSVSEEM